MSLMRPKGAMKRLPPFVQHRSVHVDENGLLGITGGEEVQPVMSALALVGGYTFLFGRGFVTAQIANGTQPGHLFRLFGARIPCVGRGSNFLPESFAPIRSEVVFSEVVVDAARQRSRSHPEDGASNRLVRSDLMRVDHISVGEGAREKERRGETGARIASALRRRWAPRSKVLGGHQVHRFKRGCPMRKDAFVSTNCSQNLRRGEAVSATWSRRWSARIVAFSPHAHHHTPESLVWYECQS